MLAKLFFEVQPHRSSFQLSQVLIPMRFSACKARHQASVRSPLNVCGHAYPISYRLAHERRIGWLCILSPLTASVGCLYRRFERGLLQRLAGTTPTNLGAFIWCVSRL